MRVSLGVLLFRAVVLVVLFFALGVHDAHATDSLLDSLRSQQVVVVTTKEWGSTAGTLIAFERIQGTWKRTEIQGTANLGRTGLIWGEGLHPKQPGRQKYEGDGKSPAGVFGFGTAFGYQPSLPTRMPYEEMNDSHYCIDVDGSPLYNQIVDSSRVGYSAVAGSTERMRRDLVNPADRQYAKGLVILSNPKNLQGKGSCIFMHLWPKRDTVTLGCTAVDEKVLDALLGWLDPQKRPVFVLLPLTQYDAKQKEWGLPILRKGT
jgi:L,D-peptidoglycan transpeptidase YkuD (ErfK/YbiS/YcfS/YnhG family)